MCDKCIGAAVEDFGVPLGQTHGYIKGRSARTAYRDNIRDANYMPPGDVNLPGAKGRRLTSCKNK